MPCDCGIGHAARACATAPETGRSQLLSISPSQEAQMGFQAFSKMKGKPPEFLSTQPVDNTRIVKLERLMPQAMDEYKRARLRR